MPRPKLEYDEIIQELKKAYEAYRNCEMWCDKPGLPAIATAMSFFSDGNIHMYTLTCAPKSELHEQINAGMILDERVDDVEEMIKSLDELILEVDSVIRLLICISTYRLYVSKIVSSLQTILNMAGVSVRR